MFELLGDLWAPIGAALGAVVLILGILWKMLTDSRKAGANEREVEHARASQKVQENLNARTNNARKNESAARRNAESGGLRQDDGYKRK